MISYETALKTAKELKKNIDKCIEYDSAYMFTSKEDEGSIGGSGPCVILKDSGKAINQTYYYDTYKAEFIRAFSV
ncbi:MAG: hypothetical protein Q4B86_06590 [Eubacteriales bacterium]|nr:hypothetical protein [Eubacteriales bacterium]